MSIEDRYLRIMNNDLPKDKSAMEGLRAVERFLIDTAVINKEKYHAIKSND